MEVDYPMRQFNERYSKDLGVSFFLYSVVTPIALLAAYVAGCSPRTALYISLSAFVAAHVGRMIVLRQKCFALRVQEVVVISMVAIVAILSILCAILSCLIPDRYESYKTMNWFLWIASLLSTWWDFVLIYPFRKRATE